jgi:hypothetical protein
MRRLPGRGPTRGPNCRGGEAVQPDTKFLTCSDTALGIAAQAGSLPHAALFDQMAGLGPRKPKMRLEERHHRPSCFVRQHDDYAVP